MGSEFKTKTAGPCEGGLKSEHMAHSGDRNSRSLGTKAANAGSMDNERNPDIPFFPFLLPATRQQEKNHRKSISSDPDQRTFIERGKYSNIFVAACVSLFASLQSFSLSAPSCPSHWGRNDTQYLEEFTILVLTVPKHPQTIHTRRGGESLEPTSEAPQNPQGQSSDCVLLSHNGDQIRRNFLASLFCFI